MIQARKAHDFWGYTKIWIARFLSESQNYEETICFHWVMISLFSVCVLKVTGIYVSFFLAWTCYFRGFSRVGLLNCCVSFHSTFCYHPFRIMISFFLLWLFQTNLPVSFEKPSNHFEDTTRSSLNRLTFVLYDKKTCIW